MPISKLTFINPSFSSKDISRKRIAKTKSVSKDVYLDNLTKGSIFGYKEIAKLYQFAKLNKTDNIALAILPSPIIDCKYVKTQTDLNNKTGEWLDITDYDPERY